MGWGLGRGGGGGKGTFIRELCRFIKKGSGCGCNYADPVPLYVRSADLGSEMSLAERRGVIEPAPGWDLFVYHRMVSVGLRPAPAPLGQANKFSLGLSWRWQEDRAGCFVWALYDFSPPFLSLKRNVIIRAFVVSTGASEKKKSKKKKSKKNIYIPKRGVTVPAGEVRRGWAGGPLSPEEWS